MTVRVGARGRRYFGSVGPLGLLLIIPALLLLVVWRFVVLLARFGCWLIRTVARFVVGSVLWVLAYLSRREEAWSPSRRDEG